MGLVIKEKTISAGTGEIRATMAGIELLDCQQNGRQNTKETHETR